MLMLGSKTARKQAETRAQHTENKSTRTSIRFALVANQQKKHFIIVRYDEWLMICCTYITWLFRDDKSSLALSPFVAHDLLLLV